MTEKQIQDRARALFTDEAMQQKWIRSVLLLGQKWLLANPVQRKTEFKGAGNATA